MAKKFLTGLQLLNLTSDPAAGVEGELYYNTTNDVVKIYSNGLWSELTGTTSSVYYQAEAPQDAEIGAFWVDSDSTGSAALDYNLTSYLTQSNASATYLTQSNASSVYAPKTSPTFTGLVSSGPISITQSSNHANYPITISSANETGGGTGYSDILKLTNSKSGATNINKHIRLNSTGGLEIVNSAYSDTIFFLADNGNLSELGTVNGATLEDTGWQTVSSFANNFTGTSVAYRKINNVVYLRGRVSGGTAGAGAFTIASGYRPGIEGVFVVQQYGTANMSYVTIGADGVLVPNANAAWLSGISFPVG